MAMGRETQSNTAHGPFLNSLINYDSQVILISKIDNVFVLNDHLIVYIKLKLVQ